MKKFFKEFKIFITRGNILDMAVGVIVGGAFTSIVNALSNHILKPIINVILATCLGSNSLDGIYTYLKKAYVVDELGNKTTTIDVANSIYIDWGEFINAIINFILIALVLFCIVKLINNFSKSRAEAKAQYQLEIEAVKKYRKDGLSKKEAVAKYKEDLALEEKNKQEAEAKAKQEAEKARIEKETANTKLLEEIRDLLKNNK